MNVEQQLKFALSQFNVQFLAFKNIRTHYFLKLKNNLTSPIALAGAAGVGFLATVMVKRPHTLTAVRNKRKHVMHRIRRGTRFAVKAYALWTALRGGSAVIDRAV